MTYIIMMFLFVTLTVITLFDAFKFRIISAVLKLIPEDTKINFLKKSIKELEDELSEISIATEFAKHMKLQRKINKLQKEKKDLVKGKAFKLMKIRCILVTTVYVILWGSLINLVWIYRSVSVIEVPPHWLWPVSSCFDWFYHLPGSITVPCWVAISSSASKTIAKHF